MPSVGVQPLTSDVFDRDNALAATLAGLGYRECMTLPCNRRHCRTRSRARFRIPASSRS